MSVAEAIASPWRRASLSAALFAVDPIGSGLLLRAGAGPVRDLFISRLGEALRPRRMTRTPAQIGDDRLIGGLDIAATLRAGKPVAELGVLASTDDGVLLIPMAERMSAGFAARLGFALDVGETCLQRDGIARRWSSRIGVVALDEGIDEECAPAGLIDRLAFWCDIDDVSIRDVESELFTSADYARARALLPLIKVDEGGLASLTATALAVGVGSLRAPIFALRAARALAALRGSDHAEEEDINLAAALVLGPRAIRLPEKMPNETEAPEAEDHRERESAESASDDMSAEPEISAEMEEQVQAPEKAILASGLLELMTSRVASRNRRSRDGASGQETASSQRGRPLEPRPGDLSKGRLSVIATLRAAAPWRRIRLRTSASRHAKVIVTPEDFRVVRFRRRRGSTAIFVVDASGSQAIGRLAEAKGAIQLLLADCYVRRDMVALIAFRGKTADVILPPTRSIARARRELIGLPGGGGTPLAAGLAAAVDVAEQSARKGFTPLVVLMTDGRANIGRNGAAGRASAMSDALEAARRIAEAKVAALVIDTSSPAARSDENMTALAQSMQARHIKLPLADAASVNAAIRLALPK